MGALPARTNCRALRAAEIFRGLSVLHILLCTKNRIVWIWSFFSLLAGVWKNLIKGCIMVWECGHVAGPAGLGVVCHCFHNGY